MTPLLSIIMPCYNEEETLEQIVARVLEQPQSKELIIIDDGSADRSRALIAELQQRHPEVVGVLQPQNMGKGAALRTGFAIEAARLLSSSGPPAVEDILAVWSGQSPPPRGAALPEHARLGRYHTPILSPYEEGAPHLPVYGGGLRLSSADGDEDIAIAALEALYWLPDTRADAIAPWVDDPRPAVRRTAARLLRLTSSDVFDMEALLTKLAAEHDDAGVRWHAADGLERRSFEAPEASPPPGIPMGKPGNPRKDHP